MSGDADELIKKYETCYAYNKSFNFYYRKPMPRHECEEKVSRSNECKGGEWEVRRKVDFEEHFILLCSRPVRYAGDGGSLYD